MMNKKVRTNGFVFVENLSVDNLSKEDIFENLYRILGPEAELSALTLPTSPAVIKLYSVKAEVRIRNNEQRIAGIYQKLRKIKADKTIIADELKILSAQAEDYAVIAIGKYLQLSKKHTIESFYKEYEEYKENPRVLTDENWFMFTETEEPVKQLMLS